MYPPRPLKRALLAVHLVSIPTGRVGVTMATNEERRRQLKRERRRRYRARQPSRLVVLDESQDPSEIQDLVPQEDELKG